MVIDRQRVPLAMVELFYPEVLKIDLDFSGDCCSRGLVDTTINMKTSPHSGKRAIGRNIGGTFRSLPFPNLRGSD